MPPKNSREDARVRQYTRSGEDYAYLMSLPEVEREAELERRHREQLWAEQGQEVTVAERRLEFRELSGDDHSDFSVASDDAHESYSYREEEEDVDEEPNIVRHSDICGVILPGSFILTQFTTWFYKELITTHAFFLLKLEAIDPNTLPGLSGDKLIPIRIHPELSFFEHGFSGHTESDQADVAEHLKANSDPACYYVRVAYPVCLKDKLFPCTALAVDEQLFGEVRKAATQFTEAMFHSLKAFRDHYYQDLDHAALVQSEEVIRAVLNCYVSSRPETEHMQTLIRMDSYIFDAMSPLPFLRVNQINARLDALEGYEQRRLERLRKDFVALGPEERQACYTERTRHLLHRLREELEVTRQKYRASLGGKEEVQTTVYAIHREATKDQIEASCLSPNGRFGRIWERTFKALREEEKGLAIPCVPPLVPEVRLTHLLDGLVPGAIVRVSGQRLYFTGDEESTTGYHLYGPRYRVELARAQEPPADGTFSYLMRYLDGFVHVFKFTPVPVEAQPI
ncbi:hypothetical protein GMRT_13418 [Giardia muris]|uniref:Uncharacterized protein n=1 Tax=Giardia muris TaxID=5742 RepID=A0A4Z1SL79_GIAMU|nr:hypothetical protein GMRT_13418 [Giardia muris]|eukprot:TNJ26386.1 hypothetical protein GMRT_13418 [Giardia muris]